MDQVLENKNDAENNAAGMSEYTVTHINVLEDLLRNYANEVSKLSI